MGILMYLGLETLFTTESFSEAIPALTAPVTAETQSGQGFNLAAPGEAQAQSVAEAQSAAQAQPAAEAQQLAQNQFARPESGLEVAQAQTPSNPQVVANHSGTQNSNDYRRRMEDLDTKEKSLKELEARLNVRMNELNTLENQLKQTLQKADEEKAKRTRHLIDIYSNMNAKQAAAALETLDEGRAVEILGGMRGRQAGEILSFVSAKKAARLSEELLKLRRTP